MTPLFLEPNWNCDFYKWKNHGKTIVFAAPFLILSAFRFQKSLFSAAQLLWLNLIMDALASIALTGDTPSKFILRHKPYGRDKPLISRSILRNIIGHCIYQIAVIFIIVFLFADFTDTKDGYTVKNICKPSQHATMVFTTLILMQIFNEINCRRVEDRNVFCNKDDHFDWVFLFVILFCFFWQVRNINAIIVMK